MEHLPYALLAALQDLLALYYRLSPGGPWRHSLFHDQVKAGAGWPEPLLRSSARLDMLIRGVSCLVANGLPAAALPLVAALWQALRRLIRQLDAMGEDDPEYFHFLTRELRQPELPPAMVCRMYGEVLAVYLDLLRMYTPEERIEAGDINRLRQCLLQAGDSSS